MILEYCGRSIDVGSENVWGLNLSFCAFGLRNLERVIRKMFWFRVEFNMLDMEDYEEGTEMETC